MNLSGSRTGKNCGLLRTVRTRRNGWQGLGVVYQACSFLLQGSPECTFYELDGEIYHKLLLRAHKLISRRGAYLAENIDRA